MTPSPWSEPVVCRECTARHCTGNPGACEQDREDGRSDYEYERRGDL